MNRKKKEKDKQINKEIERLNHIYRELEEDKKGAVKGLIEELAFMMVTLEDLKETIKEEGTIDIMPQGSYSVKRSHPAIKQYTSLIQKYSKLTKQITDLLPKDEEVEDDKISALEEFAKSRAR